MNENLSIGSTSIGYELAWEVRRLADESPYSAEQAEILDFGDTDYVAYRSKPWGLIAVEFESEYVSVHGQLRATKTENPCIATILAESRYRSVVATGDLLCDWEWYEIHANGTIQATLSKGEFSNVEEVQTDASEAKDMTTEIFGHIELLPGKTPLQEHIKRRMDDLYELQVSIPEEERPAIAKEITDLEFSGEESTRSRLPISPSRLNELLAQLKSLGSIDKLGTISPVSIVDGFEEEG